MDKEPNKVPMDNDDDYQKICIQSVPLMVLIAGFLSSIDFVDWIFTMAEMLIVFVLAYQILGRVLFTALIVTPILVVFISRCLQSYDEIMFGDDDDIDGGDDDDDPHFGDHFNNLMK